MSARGPAAAPATPPASAAGLWTPARAEAHLRSLELFGMRFGLDRMRRLLTVLGSPQRRFRSLQVLGTNGKSSTTKMIAAILERHGLRTGAYTSPHLVSYGERLQVAQRDVSAEAFARAIGRAASATERVNRSLPGDDHVTQFELLTAAALSEMAEQEVQVAVVEAGLGGRYDATSVIESPVTVLTNVALEHTRWLGPTVRDIAGEKLAVVRPGGTLVLAPDLDPQALAVAREVAGERGARIVWASEPPLEAPEVAEGETEEGGGELSNRGARARVPAPAPARTHAHAHARAAFQRKNFALATAAAEAFLREAHIELDPKAVREAELTVEVAGRLHTLADEPLTILDGAHNPHAVAALVESLPAAVGGREVGLVMGVLEDKDAATMLATLLPLCGRAWFTAPDSPRALSPAALQSLARQLGFERAACEPDPGRALGQARAWAAAGDTPANGRAVLATGSVYLVGELLRDDLGWENLQ
ncbi:MAG TPA: Mur ligase family protein [Solirubrobacteraceae bacterium]|nr:Mur ligase family protein [Solirubrobacteraceae bacterium]